MYDKRVRVCKFKLTSVDPIIEKKTAVTLRDLVQDAPEEEVSAVRNALLEVVDEPITSVTATETYAFA